jgi:hypothetical protein
MKGLQLLLQARVIKDINKGDQLFFSYGDAFWEEDKAINFSDELVKDEELPSDVEEEGEDSKHVEETKTLDVIRRASSSSTSSTPKIKSTSSSSSTSSTPKRTQEESKRLSGMQTYEEDTDTELDADKLTARKEKGRSSTSQKKSKKSKLITSDDDAPLTPDAAITSRTYKPQTTTEPTEKLTLRQKRKRASKQLLEEQARYWRRKIKTKNLHTHSFCYFFLVAFFLIFVDFFF